QVEVRSYASIERKVVRETQSARDAVGARPQHRICRRKVARYHTITREALARAEDKAAEARNIKLRVGVRAHHNVRAVGNGARGSARERPLSNDGVAVVGI